MSHKPTKILQDTVTMHAMIGTPQEDIARVIGIDAKTLRLHYRDELDLAALKANATIGGALFNKAKGGDTSAMIFWMKTRAGWREKSEEISQSQQPIHIEIVNPYASDTAN